MAPLSAALKFLSTAFALLLVQSPLSAAVLRGDDAMQLSRTRDVLREKLSGLQDGTPEHLATRLEFEQTSHKLRALEFLDHGMTQDEYNDFTKLIEKQHDMKHRHETSEEFDENERMEFARVNREVKTILNKYKTIRSTKRDPAAKEDLDKIIALREKLAATDDRDEMEVIRAELEEIYKQRPRLTKLGRQKFKQRAQAAKDRKRQRKGAKSKFPDMDDETLARVTELREKIHATDDRDELVRLRQALKFERDQAALAEKERRDNTKSKGKRRPPNEEARAARRKAKEAATANKAAEGTPEQA